MMASKEQKKIQKKKAREKVVKQKILFNREKLRAPIREAREELARHKRVRKIVREMDKFEEHMDASQLLSCPNKTLSQVEKNIQILKAIEAEQAAEEKRRSDLNQQLEEAGVTSLEEKLGVLHEKIAQAETADVSVIKANPENS